MARTLSPTAKLATGITALALAGTLSIGGAWALGTQLRDGSTVTSTSAAAAASPSTAGTQPVRGRGFPGGAQTIPGYAGQAVGGQVTAAPTEATAAQLTGVVDIVTTVDYGSGEAAGTGIVLASDGEILTNNHVIEGSTSIEVRVLSTGQTYTAHVVGTSPTNDIAVLRLDGASGLATAPMGDSSTVAVGDEVVGVGNAGNAAGTSAEAGTVTALGESITATDSGGGNAEALTGLIMTNAGIQAGDSGGPLLSAGGTVIGIDTAAQTSSRSGTTVAGYAIPINHALDIATQILSGVDNETIHQGLPAFLGVSMNRATAAGGAIIGTTIAGTVSGSAAEAAGLAAGDTITSIGGTSIASAQALTDAIAAHSPGDQVSLTWTGQDGVSHETTVTLGSGPAD